MLEHSPYLSYWLLRLPPMLKLKKFCGWKIFESNKEVIAVNGYFEDLPQSHIRDEIQFLEKRGNYYIQNGNYLDNSLTLCEPEEFE